MTQVAAKPMPLSRIEPVSRPCAPVRTLRLAYLTTEYPKVSHTFIRREILELERRGHHLLRLAIRNGGTAVADAADRVEAARTIHCLSQPKWRLVRDVVVGIFARPARFVKAFGMTLEMSRSSDRGVLRHLAYLSEAAMLLRFLTDARIEHLHVHFGTNAAAVAQLIRSLGGPPYSLTIHGPNEFDSPRGFSLAQKVIDSEFTVAISDYCVAQLRRWVPFEHWSKIHVVRCTVGEEFFDHSAPIPACSNTLLSVGRLTPQKGQLVLIEAMKRLIDDGIGAHLVLAGDGEMRAEIERRITALHLQSHVEITGWIDEATVRKHLRAARALVQPSFAEGLPVVIMEAMAMGRPVISTMIAGIPELVRDRESGWLVPAGNVEQLADAMRQALQAPLEALNSMGQAGREGVRRHHLTATEVDRLESLFSKSLLRKGER
ncbi:MAG: glycosyltransferase [Phycisphaerales bacterium]|nr:glycosyltransferase [Phycisphaerales bacterium]MCI0629915.1 glycosyltransferase [Phycisphaerales bacterium]MCI0677152.1 glycosyltransferase [Phycisphaerales bacterium]